MAMETSHIWLGRFPSEAALDAYFEESYGEDDQPINQFAADQGERFYDHDWVERSFDPSGDLRAQIAPHSHSKDYLDRVIELARSRGIVGANVFILADKGEFDRPVSVHAPSHSLWYLGEFVCEVGHAT
jgi:hypothetical protein